MYRLDIPPDGRVGKSTVLETDTWYDVKLDWTGTEDKAAHVCRIYIDGTLLPTTLPLNNTSRNGIWFPVGEPRVPWIDAAEAQLPELRTFILPGGSPAAAALHLARTVVRRA